MLLSAASVGLLTYFNALFVTPVTEDFGISRSTFLLHSTFLTVTVMVMMPFTGKLFQRYPMKVLLALGSLLGASAFLCFSFADSIKWFYLGGVLAGAGSCLFGAIPMALLVANWFNEKRGMATGISFTGASIVSMLLSPFISRIIEIYGWRIAYRTLGMLVILIMVPNILWLIKVKPEDIGEKSYGVARSGESKKLGGYTQKEALKEPAFWLLALAVLLLGIVITPTQQQLIVYWQDIGNSGRIASMMYSLAVCAGIFEKVILGGIFDKLGATRASIVCGGIAALTFITLIVCNRGYVLAIPAALFGGLLAIQVVALPYLTNSFFGNKEYGSIYGLITLVLYLGVSIGIPLSSAAFDRLGTYQPVWAVFAVAILLFAVLVGRAEKSLNRRKERQK